MRVEFESLDQLIDIYFKSVGRNSVLLLNVPPDDRGLIADPDIRRLREFRAALDRAFADDLTRGKRLVRGDAPLDAKNGLIQEVDLGRPTPFNIVLSQEDTRQGQHVSRYRIEARAYSNDLVASEPLAVSFEVERAPFPWGVAALSFLLAIALVALWWGGWQNRRLAEAN